MATATPSRTWWPRRRARGGSQARGPGSERGAGGSHVRFLGAKPTRNKVAKPPWSRGSADVEGGRDPVRPRYTKRGKISWISHRTVRPGARAIFPSTQLPLAFHRGFSPRPKVSFGLAVFDRFTRVTRSTSTSCRRERSDLEPLAVSLTEALPDGMAFTGAVPLASRRAGVARSGDLGRVRRSLRGRAAHRSTRPSSARTWSFARASGAVTSEAAKCPRV